jgi:ribosomal protein S6
LSFRKRKTIFRNSRKETFKAQKKSCFGEANMVRLGNMRSYELILVIKPSLSEALRKKLLAGIKTMLKDLKITKENEVGTKTLAYKIKREAKGFYMEMFAEGENIPADFEKKLLENDNILRHLLLRIK